METLTPAEAADVLGVSPNRVRQLLRDGGFTEQEAFDWLFREDPTLPGTPVAALRGDRHTEITRRAQALAL